MRYDFKTVPDRRAVPGEKWGRYAGRDILPMWVADMDFAVAPEITAALQARLAHPVLGYTDPWPGLIGALQAHLLAEFDWHIEPDWLVWLPGVVSGLSLSCRATGSVGDEVVTATPVYPPFRHVPANSERTLRETALVFDRTHRRWQWDVAAAEALFGPRSRLLMLCNPHNPVGRVYDDDELAWLAELARRHDLIVCSDEIHCGLVLDEDRRRRTIATLSDDMLARTITLMAPSKTWNVPGLYCSVAIIADPALRRAFRRAAAGLVGTPNVLGLVAAEAAWRDGGAWRAQLLATLRDNRDAVLAALGDLPGVHVTRPEATYLAWIDLRERNIADPVAFCEDAGVGVSDGAAFGMAGFVRLNFGCPRSLLDEGLRRLRSALA